MNRRFGLYVILAASALLTLALVSIRANWPSYITWASFGAGMGLVAASVWSTMKSDDPPPGPGESH